MAFGKTVLASLLGVVLLDAQASAQNAAPGAKAAAQPEAQPKSDPPKFDPKDLTGIWMQARGRPFKDYPFTPEYQAILKKRQDDGAAGKPFQVAGSTCLPAGLVASMTTGAYPIEIFYQKGGKEILFQKEIIGALYRVYLNRPHKAAEDLYPLFYGDSVGRWEGDILVVDTISLGGSLALDLIAPHSDALHVVQRFHRVSYDTMEDEITLDDPKALTKQATGTAIFKYHPDWEISEFECSNERFNTDDSGNQTLASPAK